MEVRAAYRRMEQSNCCHLQQNGARALLPLAAKWGSKVDAACRRLKPNLFCRRMARLVLV